MAKQHTITAALIVSGLVLAATTAHAQYMKAYNDGYVDHVPFSGTPDHSTEYGRGWNAGRDAADEEFSHMLRRLDNPSDIPVWADELRHD